MVDTINPVGHTGIRLGEKFGRLTAIANAYDLPMPNGEHKSSFLCQCDCPRHTLMVVPSNKLKNGMVKSCGCLDDEEISKIVGLGPILDFLLTPELAVDNYRRIYDRCHNPESIGYHNRNGAGIDLCDRWKDPIYGLRNFYEDMGPSYKMTHDIERYDRNLGYFPENCYWKYRPDMKYDRKPRKEYTCTYDGCTFTCDQWDALLGYNPGLVFRRLTHLDWTTEQILFGKMYYDPVYINHVRTPNNAIYFLDDNGQPDFSIDPQEGMKRNP